MISLYIPMFVGLTTDPFTAITELAPYSDAQNSYQTRCASPTQHALRLYAELCTRPIINARHPQQHAHPRQPQRPQRHRPSPSSTRMHPPIQHLPSSRSPARCCFNVGVALPGEGRWGWQASSKRSVHLSLTGCSFGFHSPSWTVVLCHSAIRLLRDFFQPKPHDQTFNLKLQP